MRTAVVQLMVGDKTATVAARFLDHLKKALRKHGITLCGVLSDNCPEFVGRAARKSNLRRATTCCNSGIPGSGALHFRPRCDDARGKTTGPARFGAPSSRTR